MHPPAKSLGESHRSPRLPAPSGWAAASAEAPSAALTHLVRLLARQAAAEAFARAVAEEAVR